MALQPKEKKLLKILAGVVVVGGFIMFRSSQPQEIATTESDPDKVAELEAKKKAKTTTKTSSRPPGGSGGGSASRSGGSGGSRGAAPTISTVSVSDFESHNSPESCWVLIDGKVYDITEYLKNSQEPDKVAAYCGTFGFEEGYLEEISSTKEAIIDKASLKGTIG